MTTANSSVLLPESILRVAVIQARIRSVSLKEWVSRIIAERLDTSEGAREFFRRRAWGATGDALGRALAAVPSRPPDPGDELDPDLSSDESRASDLARRQRLELETEEFFRPSRQRRE